MTVSYPSLSAPRLFFGLLSLGVVAGCAGYAALVLGTTTWAEAQALDALFPYYYFHIRPFRPADLHQLRTLLAGVALVAGTAWVGLGPARRRGRAELAATGREVGQAGGRLAAAWRQLPRSQRRLAGWAMALLTAVRAYLSPTLLWYDDAVSYEFFVRHRLLAVSAYYPLPNNHIFSNTINWLFYQVHPTFWWSMRLPVLLTSTLATGLLFAGLLRRAGFWGALLAAGAFSWLELSLYHAAAGRGYWLVSLLAGVIFFCLLALVSQPEPETSPPAGRARAAWLGLVGASVLACYTVPTAAYVVASAFSWLGVQALRRRAGRQLGPAVGAGLLVAAALGLLYTPVLLVSGWASLAANPYVHQQELAAFWRGLPAYLWFNEGFLAGQRRIGAVLTVAGLALFGRQLYRAAAGRLPARAARRVRELGLPALWFMGLPYAVLTVQHVLPPERTLLYKAWFFFIVLGLAVADWPWHRAGLRWLAAVAGGLFMAGETGLTVRANYQLRASTAGYRGVYEWLAARAPRAPTVVADLGMWAWIRFAVHIDESGRATWPTDQAARPGVRYRYLVVRRGTPRPAAARRVVYTNGDFLIYTYAAPAGS